MYQESTPLFMRCLTATHVGSGNDLGYVDLPIQREGHTNFPKFEASSLKGAMRQRIEELTPSDTTKQDFKEKTNLVFGYDPQGEDKTFTDAFTKKYDKEYTGALAFSDARLLCFPVKSMKGIYALATCPFVLKRFVSDMQMCGFSLDASFTTVVNGLFLNEGECHAPDSKCFEKNGTKSLVLEEYAFTNKSAGQANTIAAELKKHTAQTDLAQHLVILSDDDFLAFVENSTEIITRIKIKNETGVVEGGALFTEEYLPCESLLYSMVFASPVFQTKKEGKTLAVESAADVLNFLTKTLINKTHDKTHDFNRGLLQIGANTTLAKGIVSLHFPNT